MGREFSALFLVQQARRHGQPVAARDGRGGVRTRPRAGEDALSDVRAWLLVIFLFHFRVDDIMFYGDMQHYHRLGVMCLCMGCVCV